MPVPNARASLETSALSLPLPRANQNSTQYTRTSLYIDELRLYEFMSVNFCERCNGTQRPVDEMGRRRVVRGRGAGHRSMHISFQARRARARRLTSTSMCAAPSMRAYGSGRERGNWKRIDGARRACVSLYEATETCGSDAKENIRRSSGAHSGF